MGKKEINLKSQISDSWESDEFQEFANTMQALFPKESLLEETNENKKLKLAYSALHRKKCTYAELRDTMKEFIDSHQRNFWMPADINEAFKTATATSRFRI